MHALHNSVPAEPTRAYHRLPVRGEVHDSGALRAEWRRHLHAMKGCEVQQSRLRIGTQANAGMPVRGHVK